MTGRASRDGGRGSLIVVPLDLKRANAIVSAWHRHHRPVLGHRFSIGLIDSEGDLHGCAIVGRPVARLGGEPDRVLEVLRVATDGTANACSKLLAAAARAGKAMGFVRIQTYTLPVEGGASLRATGWIEDGVVDGRKWAHTDGRARANAHPTVDKVRWVCVLNPEPPATNLPPTVDESQGTLL